MNFVSFRIQVTSAKLVSEISEFVIGILHQMFVGMLLVKRIKTMKSNDVEAFKRYTTIIMLAYHKHVLVVSPGHREITQTTVWRIDSVSGTVELIIGIGIKFEEV